MQHPKDRPESKDEFAAEVKKLRERVAELETIQKRSKDIEKIITVQRNLALACNETHDLEKGLKLCLEAAIKVSGLDCGGVYLIDENTGDMNMVFHSGLPADFVKSATYFNAQSPNTKLVMKGKPVYSKHHELGVPLSKARSKEKLLAIAVIPIKHEGNVIACLNAASHTLEEVPEHARNSLETIANQIGSSIAHLKTEEALKDSEKKWSSLIKHSKDIITIIDSEGTIQQLNRAITLRSPVEVIGEKIYDYLPEDQEKLIEKNVKFLNTGPEKLGK